MPARVGIFEGRYEEKMLIKSSRNVQKVSILACRYKAT